MKRSNRKYRGWMWTSGVLSTCLLAGCHLTGHNLRQGLKHGETGCDTGTCGTADGCAPTGAKLGGLLGHKQKSSAIVDGDCGTGTCGTGTAGGHFKGRFHNGVGLDGHRLDRCATITPGAIPQPIGVHTRRFQDVQAGKAEADDFVIYLYEWAYERDLELGPYGRAHMHDMIRRLPKVPFPVVIQVCPNDDVNQARQAKIIEILAAAGIADAPGRVVVGYPRAEGLDGNIMENIYANYFASGGGSGGFGGGFGGGGFGGGGFGGGSGFGSNYGLGGQLFGNFYR